MDPVRKLTSTFAAKLGFDQPLQLEAAEYAMQILVVKCGNPLDVDPTDAADDLAEDIAIFLDFEGQPLHRHKAREWIDAWAGDVLVAFREAQRLCIDES